jgi:hypothetical protein
VKEPARDVGGGRLVATVTDRGNLLVPLVEIESAVLSRRLGICKLELLLTDETRPRFIWVNLSVNANYDHVTETLTDLLPERLRAS